MKITLSYIFTTLFESRKCFKFKSAFNIWKTFKQVLLIWTLTRSPQQLTEMGQGVTADDLNNYNFMWLILCDGSNQIWQSRLLQKVWLAFMISRWICQNTSCSAQNKAAIKEKNKRLLSWKPNLQSLQVRAAFANLTNTDTEPTGTRRFYCKP